MHEVTSIIQFLRWQVRCKTVLIRKVTNFNEKDSCRLVLTDWKVMLYKLNSTLWEVMMNSDLWEVAFNRAGTLLTGLIFCLWRKFYMCTGWSFTEFFYCTNNSQINGQWIKNQLFKQEISFRKLFGFAGCWRFDPISVRLQYVFMTSREQGSNSYWGLNWQGQYRATRRFILFVWCQLAEMISWFMRKKGKKMKGVDTLYFLTFKGTTGDWQCIFPSP